MKLTTRGAAALALILGLPACATDAADPDPELPDVAIDDGKSDALTNLRDLLRRTETVSLTSPGQAGGVALYEEGKIWAPWYEVTLPGDRASEVIVTTVRSTERPAGRDALFFAFYLPVDGGPLKLLDPHGSGLAQDPGVDADPFPDLPLLGKLSVTPGPGRPLRWFVFPAGLDWYDPATLALLAPPVFAPRVEFQVEVRDYHYVPSGGGPY